MNDIALIRSVTNKEGQHQRATYQLHTGYLPTGSVRHPSLAANIAKQLADLSHDLPAVVSVGQTIGSGYLGVDYEPFVVDNPEPASAQPRSAGRPPAAIRAGSGCSTSSRTISPAAAGKPSSTITAGCIKRPRRWS